MPERQAILRTVRNAAISIVALLVVFVGAGFGYAWWSGQGVDEQAVLQATQPATATSAAPTMSPPKLAKDAPVQASVQSFTDEVEAGDNASIMVKTSPSAKCQITAKYDDIKSEDSGLKTKTADEWGIVEWAWTVDASAPDGRWPVDVSCVRGEKSAMVRGWLLVGKQD